MIKTFFSLFALLMAATSAAQSTKVLTAEKANEYGVVYSLPLTALEIEVTATHQVAKAGPFYPYAKKYAGATEVVKEDSESWTIGDVKVRPYGVPDSETQYLMQLRPGTLTFLEVDADGMLLAINSRVAARPQPLAAEATLPVKFPNGQEYLQFVNEDFVASKSSQKQAQILAEILMEVRDSRLSLTRGTADAMPADGRQMELMLASLSEQEAAITAAFTGTVTSETVTRKFTFIPDQAGKSVLFRMSPFAGIVEPDDLSGAPVYINVEETDQPSMPLDAKGQPKKLPKNAVVYALPGSAKVSIALSGKSLFEREFQFAQFGTTFGLDPALFTDKKAPAYATFDPVTGALVEVGTAK